MEKFQLKGERFGGGGRYFGRGRRGGFRGGFSRQGDTCYKCGGTGHWAVDCKGQGNEASHKHTHRRKLNGPLVMASNRNMLKKDLKPGLTLN